MKILYFHNTVVLIIVKYSTEVLCVETGSAGAVSCNGHNVTCCIVVQVSEE